MATYTIDRLSKPEHLTQEVLIFLGTELPKLNEKFGNKYDWENLNLTKFIQEYIFLICRRDGEIRGVCMAFMGYSPFDNKTKILQQQSLFVKPNSGRTAYHLFKKFIDIGKSEANHIITMIASQTNIKGQTLENMGFEKMEVLYRMEV